MAQHISPLSSEIAKTFTTQLVQKLTSDGPLAKLLESHLSNALSAYKVDPQILNYELQLLAYEYAIRVASEFPTKLAERLDSAKPKGHYSSMATNTPAAESNHISGNSGQIYASPSASRSSSASDSLVTTPGSQNPNSRQSTLVYGSYRGDSESKETSSKSSHKKH